MLATGNWLSIETKRKEMAQNGEAGSGEDAVRNEASDALVTPDAKQRQSALLIDADTTTLPLGSPIPDYVELGDYFYKATTGSPLVERELYENWAVSAFVGESIVVLTRPSRLFEGDLVNVVYLVYRDNQFGKKWHVAIKLDGPSKRLYTEEMLVHKPELNEQFGTTWTWSGKAPFLRTYIPGRISDNSNNNASSGETVHFVPYDYYVFDFVVQKNGRSSSWFRIPINTELAGAMRNFYDNAVAGRSDTEKGLLVALMWERISQSNRGTVKLFADETQDAQNLYTSLERVFEMAGQFEKLADRAFDQQGAIDEPCRRVFHGPVRENIQLYAKMEKTVFWFPEKYDIYWLRSDRLPESSKGRLFYIESNTPRAKALRNLFRSSRNLKTLAMKFLQARIDDRETYEDPYKLKVDAAFEEEGDFNEYINEDFAAYGVVEWPTSYFVIGLVVG